ncbi:kinesin family member 6/9 [Paragonimus westermani]|uniref:Kinesin family member 6/9 n=1 Tax=Paragonimus westermani TaxID=34504 RepID=A0A5J4P030_9TREM|nr:kinesin family member 6/9 [Paragonimus westermani]
MSCLDEFTQKSTGQILKEANYINRSLTFLEQTVLALSEPCREHIPYRQSKLTHYLKNSIGGRYQTILIANIWDEDRFIEETISTLRFASRVMRIPCQPTVKQKFDTMATIKQLQKDNALLKRELLMYDTLNNREKVNYENLTEQQKQQIRSQVVRYLDGEVTDLEVANLKQLRETFVSFKHLNHALRSQVDDLRQQLSKGAAVSDVAQPTMTGGATNVNSNAAAAVGVRMNTRVTNIKKQGNMEAEKPQSILQVGELDPSSGFGVVATDGIPPVTPVLVQDSAVMQVKRKERRRSNASPKGTRRSICQSPTQTFEDSAKAKE